jgi:hypothetical protein
VEGARCAGVLLADAVVAAEGDAVTSRHIENVDIEPGDPHNDQTAARAREDLAWHVRSARDTLTQTPGPAEAIATIAVALGRNRVHFPRDRLAAMLAAALVTLAEEKR